MSESIKEIFIEEKNSLIKLMNILEKQHGYIINKEIFNLEGIVEEIQEVNKEVAQWEVKRRRATSGLDLVDYINNNKDEELENLYREIRMLLEELRLQKDTNELLIKQQLSFTNRLLTIINPRRDIDTYNSYGKIKR
ncbi:flagellar protein FlgN [Clostridium sp. 'White wine YQ']|uniref:flagellar protein FlgN n=1 Tax=Clostridium sp. 'White wine YQ' TaxID=3027474 RepID=UPI002366C782|nr:flagellar protein FlgN [Clostridium sp. 'White wine YQ']MDD7794634.1 flagellar protein FlgN [Clostridium sp. 'White wine YQ']